MKNLRIKVIVLVMVMGIISNNIMAQKGTGLVPQAVLSAFSTNYSQAYLTNWKKSNDQFVASFTLNKEKCKAYYTKDGSWIKTETEMRSLANLPLEIRSSLKKGSYASYHVDRIEDVKMPSKNMYLLQVDNESGNMSAYENAGSVDDELLYYNDNGKLIRSTQQ